MGRTKWAARVLVVTALTAAGPCADAQATPGGGSTVIPESSVEKPGDVGKRSHTNIEIFIPSETGGPTPTTPGAGSPPNPQSTGGGQAPDSDTR